LVERNCRQQRQSSVELGILFSRLSTSLSF
jgi:hypothetical protein